MLDLVGGGLLGSIFGGLFRLAPEVLKFFDRKNERAHELAMLKQQGEMEVRRGEFRVEERYVDHSVAQLEAIQEAFKEQAATASKSYRWVAAASALVRPGVTYVLFGLYVAVKLSMVAYAWQSGASWMDLIRVHWTVDDFAMLNMILTFWFVGRTIEKYREQ